MHVLIATTGVLSPEPVVEFTRQLLGQHGRVTVITVIEVPRDFLGDLEAADGAGAHPEVSIDRYMEERGHRLTQAVSQALEGAQIPYEVMYVEGGDPAAAISGAAEAVGADIVVLGATRQIFRQDAWESVSARVMLESGKPVLVVPGPPDKTEEPM